MPSASLYDPLHPAVLQLLAQTIAVGTRTKKARSRCAAKWPATPHFTALLLALGLTEFSMHPELAARSAPGHRRVQPAPSLRRQRAGLLRAQTRAGIERVLKRMNLSGGAASAPLQGEVGWDGVASAVVVATTRAATRTLRPPTPGEDSRDGAGLVHADSGMLAFSTSADLWRLTAFNWRIDYGACVPESQLPMSPAADPAPDKSREEA